MPLPAVLALDGVIRRYAWGSATAIPQLLGQVPDGEPVAELWLGAHPDDPAGVPGLDTTLDKLIAADPPALLGTRVTEAFDGQLPFLVKILAAAKALSIQVHPTADQARAGYAGEDAAGIPRQAPNRNYRDRNHKPELLCALTPFDALCGFRPAADTLRLIDAFGLDELAEVGRLLAGPDGLRAAFTHVLTLDDPSALVDAVVKRAPAVGGEWAGAAGAVAIAGADFPGDRGAVLALLLNHVRLEPGEAIYLGAGNVHCYLRGTAVEVMANSDNVLRCGLTPKHVDVDELVKITDFTPLLQPRCPTTDVPMGHGAFGFEVPIDDFAVMAVDLDAFGGTVAIGDTGPHILLCTDGASRVEAGGAAVGLQPGRAAFVAARDEALTVSGTGTVYAVTVGAL